jgi:tRNA U54 and U55 pseudouridine synthase Pus10
MRHLTAVLNDCKCRVMHLHTNDDRLEVHGPLESRPGLREELRLHQPNILTYLRTGQRHHELEPEECKVCNGYVGRFFEESVSSVRAELQALGKEVTL